MKSTPTLLIGVLLNRHSLDLQIKQDSGLVLDQSSLQFGGEEADAEVIWRMIQEYCNRVFQQNSLPANTLNTSCLVLGTDIKISSLFRKRLLEKAPSTRSLELASHVHLTLLGAHSGEPGLLVKLDTEVIAQSFDPLNQSRRIGGWGFPFDKGSSTWVSWQALDQTLSLLDGRLNPEFNESRLYQTILDRCGPTPDKVRDWLYQSSFDKFETICAIVLDFAEKSDPAAKQLLRKAAHEISHLVQALDPDHILPISICGSFAKSLKDYLPDWISVRLQDPKLPAMEGAMLLARCKDYREACVEPQISWNLKPSNQVKISLEALRPDFSSSVPLYIQLKNKFAQAIQNGIWLPGTTLPSERFLSEALEVSRITIRKTLDALLSGGLVERHQGVGTFVRQRIEQPISVLTGFSDEMKSRGLKPETRILECSSRTATPEEALILGLKPGQQISYLKRLRMADGQAVAVEYTAIPARLMPNPHMLTGSLYQYLKARKSMPVRALQHLRANIVSSSERDLLEASDDTPVLYITRIGYLHDGTPVEYTHSYYRGDRYDFIAELQTDEQASGFTRTDLTGESGLS